MCVPSKPIAHHCLNMHQHHIVRDCWVLVVYVVVPSPGAHGCDNLGCRFRQTQYPALGSCSQNGTLDPPLRDSDTIRPLCPAPMQHMFHQANLATINGKSLLMRWVSAPAATAMVYKWANLLPCIVLLCFCPCLIRLPRAAIWWPWLALVSGGASVLRAAPLGFLTCAAVLCCQVEAVLGTHTLFTNWPIETLNSDRLLDAFLAREQRDACNLQYTLDVDVAAKAVRTITIASTGGSGSCSAPLLIPDAGSVSGSSVTAPSSAGSKQLGVQLSAGGSVSLTASGLAW